MSKNLRKMYENLRKISENLRKISENFRELSRTHWIFCTTSFINVLYAVYKPEMLLEALGNVYKSFYSSRILEIFLEEFSRTIFILISMVCYIYVYGIIACIACMIASYLQNKMHAACAQIICVYMLYIYLHALRYDTHAISIICTQAMYIPVYNVPLLRYSLYTLAATLKFFYV